MRRGKAPLPVGDRFWAKVDKRGPDECWPWLGGVSRNGYGCFRVNEPVRRQPGVHRFAYEFLIGPIPAGLDVDHTCHNSDDSCAGGVDCLHRRCVNPAHLEAVPRRENVLRGKGPCAKHRRKTHCSKGHPFEGANVHVDARGYRRCRTCGREAKRRQIAKPGYQRPPSPSARRRKKLALEGLRLLAVNLFGNTQSA